MTRSKTHLRRFHACGTMVSCLVLSALLFGETASAQDRDVFFDTTAPGESKSIPTWGLDTAWSNADNFRRGVIFMGQPQVDVARVSFTPYEPLVGGDLDTTSQADFDYRMWIVNTFAAAGTEVYLNKAGDIDPWFQSGGVTIADRWAQLIDVTRQKCVTAGHPVIGVAPFNEPDFDTPQGNIAKFGEICDLLRNGASYSANFTGIDLVGGNTLNNDVAGDWYSNGGWPSPNVVDIGNTHQLAGIFDSYANFHITVNGNGDHSANDELHNVMEAIVGAEYGMDSGIWWGPAEYARGEFVKASDGDRLGYAEHRPNWTAAAVYRAPVTNKVQAFVGESERQAQPTTYEFIAKDRPVFFDGHGPQRRYTVTTTGGPGYMTAAHRNAEKVVNITWGEDPQPAIDGRYILVARHSGKVMEVASPGTNNGDNVQQYTYSGNTRQQWDVNPVPSSTGGDYSYYTITNANSGKALDLNGFSFDNGGNFHQWDAVAGANQQYILEYVEDGWFKIRSKWSGLAIDVAGPSTADGANIHQWEDLGGTNQQWRLLPVGAPIEFTAPSAPTGLVATPNDVSVDLTWNANPEGDVVGYNVYRRSFVSGQYEMIARNVTTTSYTDASANRYLIYRYKIKAVDASLNRSAYSSEKLARPTTDPTLVAHLDFENTLDDDSGNANHGTATGSALYGTGEVGTSALLLDGSNHVNLPAEVVNYDEVTIACWVRWDGGNDWQRVYDFGNGTEEFLMLTPKAGGAGLRFAIRNGGVEQTLNSSALPIGQWVHVAVTLATGEAHLYVNGVSVDDSTGITIKPSDFNPVLNQLGDSQFAADDLFTGMLDDFRIYNHALDLAGIQALAGVTPTVAMWDFEDGVAGQAFTPALPNGSGGSTDTASGILMRGYDSYWGPSWTSAASPNGGSLAMECADSHQDGYVTEGALHGWSPTAWTVECAVQFDDVAGWRTMVGRNGSSQADWEADFYLQKTDANQFRINVDTVGGMRWVVDGAYPVQAGVWYAVAAVSDGSTLSLWLDDGSGYQQVGSQDITAQSVADNSLQGSASLDWTFGRGWYNGGFVNHIDGRLDNIRFSGIARTADDLIPLHPVPDAPTGLAATTSSSSEIGLTWAASPWATSYDVKRANNIGGPYTTIAPGVTGTSYDDGALATGTTYYYVVDAHNSTGISPESSEASATTLPAAPAGLVASTVSSTQVDLSWNAVTGATSYNVQRSTTMGGPYASIGSPVGTSLSDPGRNPSTTYYYVVSAVSLGGEGAVSTEDSATTWSIAEQWRFEHFGTIANTGNAADDADPDNDGATNVFERATGGDPNVHENDLAPVLDPSAPTLSIIYRKALAATDLTFTVQESTHPAAGWITASGSETVVSDDGTVQYIRFTRPAAGEPALFLRLQISGP